MEFFSELVSNLMRCRESFGCLFISLIFISFIAGVLWCRRRRGLFDDLTCLEHTFRRLLARSRGVVTLEIGELEVGLPIGEPLESILDSEREMSDTAVVGILKNLMQLINCETICDHIYLVHRNQIESLDEDLGFLISFLKDSEKKRCEHVEVEDLVTQIIDLAHEAEDIIEFSVVRSVKQKRSASPIIYDRHQLIKEIIYGLSGCNRISSNVLEEIKSTKKKVIEIYDKKLYGIVPQVGMSSHIGGSSRGIPLSVEEETVVGFDLEAEIIKEQLTGVSKQLEVISIVGMAGLGKTTLARKVYNDLYIVHHFYIRGWTYVSQGYQKRDMLVGLLNSVVAHKKEEICKMSDEKLGEELYRGLKGKRYLIVMDDIEAWNDLKKYFPNDNNKSRILFTSRITNVALHVKPDRPPHPLRFLTEDESWELLKQKIFRTEVCPPVLEKIGKQIVRKCGGLPLAIVVVAGLLAKTDKMQDWWEQVTQSVSSHSIIGNAEQCMNTLALSYDHLPNHLKACFLYFGAFPEDYEIRVWKLIRLWIAEGFIHQIGQKSLEDVAGEYLMDLIDRSLVLVAKKKSTGEIKACRIHDLLHDFCLTKMCIPLDNVSTTLHIRSFLWFAYDHQSPSHDFLTFRHLRVLDLLAIWIPEFSDGITQLFLLRYLALRGEHLAIPDSISNLHNLETLIVSDGIGTTIPPNIWKIVKLRHLRIGGINYMEAPNFEDGYPLALDNLQTITQIEPSASCESVLARTPNLRKLGFCGHFNRVMGCFWFPDLDFLNQLETLWLLNKPTPRINNLQRVKFPPHLKRLLLSHTRLEWEEMSIIGMLPNLEALKLEYNACIGPSWETNDGGFRRLKFLRFYLMNIKQWSASSSQFPSLQRLELGRCEKLKEIPSELGDISTLQTIEVSWCSQSATNSARRIREEQKSMGNDWLQISILRTLDSGLATYS